jgi:uncharacterized protein (TIGR03066 family)
MRMSQLVVTGIIVVALTSGVRAEKKDDKQDAAKLIVGTWEVTKADKDAGSSIGDTAELTKDGKCILRHTDGKGKVETIEGTYQVEGDRVTCLPKGGDSSEMKTATIKKLTDTELVLEGPKGQTMELKRKKGS